MGKLKSADVASRTLGPCHPALIGRDRVAACICAVVDGAQWDGIDGWAGGEQRNCLGRTAVSFQADGIQPCGSAVQVPGVRERGSAGRVVRQVVALRNDGPRAIPPRRIIRHDAILRRQRPTVRDAGPGGAAEKVVGADRGVAGDGAVAEPERSGVVEAAASDGTVVVVTAAIRDVAGDSAVAERQRSGIVDAPAVDANVVAIAGGADGIAGDGAVAELQSSGVVDAAAGDATVGAAADIEPILDGQAEEIYCHAWANGENLDSVVAANRYIGRAGTGDGKAGINCKRAGQSDRARGAEIDGVARGRVRNRVPQRT